MSVPEDTYKGPRHNVEYKRLDKQHELLRNYQNNKFILAPIDRSKSNLRILDSATGVGEWLVSASDEVSPTATLIGADISPKHFASHLPKNVSLIGQNIFEEWPAEYHNSFDLVHQRFVLSTCSESASVSAIEKLFKCVKLGGYIQLHEGDSLTIQEGPNHQAFMRYRDFVKKAWSLQDFSPAPGLKLKDWLADAGAVDLVEEVQVMRAGAAAENPEQGQLATDVLLALLDSLRMHMGDFFFSQEDFRTLRSDMERELKEFGNTWHYHIVYGRKPAN
ncbi:hypothetical protein BDV95DRAFT_629587 [Massariosphaeria phaeospora]|uniref:Methyltransferase domain-containing protein n=1 Tax=Massariosphaeria phaeospora TaxID=100035 RepID=A0A7C8ML12_9PLEO|nr:hypothetical protein BDV95DRAFT_629587 [Massariosphaeria phaeospora]